MKNHLIITVGRQFGSGGRHIGKDLAKAFGIDYYDRELISEAARQSGINRKFFEKADERTPGGLFHALTSGLFTSGSAFLYDGSLSNENIFKYQSDVVRRLATEKSCVFIGRCSDYILRDNPRCVNLFIHAPIETRVERVMRTEKLDQRGARELIEKTDKTRASYYNFYTNKKWGRAASYHLSVDSSVLGIENTAVFIKHFIDRISE